MGLLKLDSPLFIVGNPRSGTTLLRLILTSHSQIIIPPECGFIIWLKNKYADWHKSNNKNSAKLAEFMDDLFACKKFDTWQLDKEAVKSEIAARQPENYAALCGVVYASLGICTGKNFTVWGDKNNFHINHLHDLLDLYKKANFLHIVRDGRDVACSYREVMAEKSSSPYAPKLNTDVADIAWEWANNVIKVDSFMNSIPNEQAMTIRYEDLVLNSSSTVRSICIWLGLPFEAEMLNFHQQNKDKKLEPELTLDWKKRTMLPISGDTVGRYASVLSVAEINKFLSVGEHALRKFSYV